MKRNLFGVLCAFVASLLILAFWLAPIQTVVGCLIAIIIIAAFFAGKDFYKCVIEDDWSI